LQWVVENKKSDMARILTTEESFRGQVTPAILGAAYRFRQESDLHKHLTTFLKKK